MMVMMGWFGLVITLHLLKEGNLGLSSGLDEESKIDLSDLIDERGKVYGLQRPMKRGYRQHVRTECCLQIHAMKRSSPNP